MADCHDVFSLFYFLLLIFFPCAFSSAESIYSLDTCNVPEEFSLISQTEFSHRYAGLDRPSVPVVFRRIPMNKQFVRMIELDAILQRYGNKSITVTTANTHSYTKQNMKLQDYIQQQIRSSVASKWGK